LSIFIKFCISLSSQVNIFKAHKVIVASASAFAFSICFSDSSAFLLASSSVSLLFLSSSASFAGAFFTCSS
jgi:hypothetical protein